MKAHLARNWKKYLAALVAAVASYYGLDPTALWAAVEKVWAPGS